MASDSGSLVGVLLLPSVTTAERLVWVLSTVGDRPSVVFHVVAGRFRDAVVEKGVDVLDRPVTAADCALLDMTDPARREMVVMVCNDPAFLWGLEPRLVELFLRVNPFVSAERKAEWLVEISECGRDLGGVAVPAVLVPLLPPDFWLNRLGLLGQLEGQRQTSTWWDNSVSAAMEDSLACVPAGRVLALVEELQTAAASGVLAWLVAGLARVSLRDASVVPVFDAVCDTVFDGTVLGVKTLRIYLHPWLSRLMGGPSAPVVPVTDRIADQVEAVCAELFDFRWEFPPPSEMVWRSARVECSSADTYRRVRAALVSVGGVGDRLVMNETNWAAGSLPVEVVPEVAATLSDWFRDGVVGAAALSEFWVANRAAFSPLATRQLFDEVVDVAVGVPQLVLRELVNTGWLPQEAVGLVSPRVRLARKLESFDGPFCVTGPASDFFGDPLLIAGDPAAMELANAVVEALMWVVETEGYSGVWEDELDVIEPEAAVDALLAVLTTQAHTVLADRVAVRVMASPLSSDFGFGSRWGLAVDLAVCAAAHLTDRLDAEAGADRVSWACLPVLLPSFDGDIGDLVAAMDALSVDPYRTG